MVPLTLNKVPLRITSDNSAISSSPKDRPVAF